MRAAFIPARGQAVVVDAPMPELKPGHALIRTRRLSLCGSDIHMLDYSAPERYPMPLGASGHEMVGRVVAIDAPGSGIEVGDVALVLAPEQHAMAEYYVAPIKHIFKLPTRRSIEEYLQAQQLGTVIYATKKLPNIVDKNVAVIGQGSAGLWWTMFLRRLGARKVVAIDLQEHRLAMSERYGATHTIHNAGIDPLPQLRHILNGNQPDLVVEAAGEVESINLAIDLVKSSGFLLYFGVPRGEIMPIQFNKLFGKCLQIQAIVNANADPGFSCYHQALELIDEGIADAKTFITHSFPLERVMDAYELQRTRDEGAVKIVVETGE
ncbi:MAG: zinc-binding dehydrogenase [Caldilineaceae bacterium]